MNILQFLLESNCNKNFANQIAEKTHLSFFDMKLFHRKYWELLRINHYCNNDLTCVEKICFKDCSKKIAYLQ